MGAVLRLGINLPTFDPLRIGGPPRFVEAARLAEEIGFDAVWVGDHLHMPAPVYDSTVALAAAAAVTERVKLGFGVMLLGPAPARLGRQAADDDRRARARTAAARRRRRRRVPAGVRGGRAQRQAARAPARRGARRAARLARGTLDAGARADDQHATADLIVGGRSDAALERAARVGDGWLSTWMSPDRMRERGEALAALAAAAGRPCPTLGLALSVHVDADEELARQRAGEYTEAQYGMPFERVERYTAVRAARERSPSGSRPTRGRRGGVRADPPDG